jgi:membrane-bound lytic murein transglycosylase B
VSVLTGRLLRHLVLAATVLTAAAVPGPAAADPRIDAGSRAAGNGWGYLVEKLVADGVLRPAAEGVFGDPRMPAFDGLGFSLVPRESSSMYRGFLASNSVALARRCLATHRAAFAAAEAATGVPAHVVAAIVHVESACGRRTGSARILPRLARLAMAGAPENLAANIARHERDGADPARVRARARYLEDLFYPEVRASFTLGERLAIDPLEIRGSEAGAFGFPQFLPTSYLRFGADGDGDGHVSLYHMADAALSCARYLDGHGWGEARSKAERRRVVWHYNRSDPYIDTVLALSARLDGEEPPVRVARTATPKRVARRRAAPAKRPAKRAPAKKAPTRTARAAGAPAL